MSDLPDEKGPDVRGYLKNGRGDGNGPLGSKSSNGSDSGNGT